MNIRYAINEQLGIKDGVSFEDLHTRQLLKMHRDAKMLRMDYFQYGYSSAEEPYAILVDKITNRLKSVLDTREHIIRGNSSKMLRKMKAHHQCTTEQLQRKHPEVWQRVLNVK